MMILIFQTNFGGKFKNPLKSLFLPVDQEWIFCKKCSKIDYFQFSTKIHVDVQYNHPKYVGGSFGPFDTILSPI